MAPKQSSVLVLGGRGKTGSRLIELLLADKIPVIATSRSGNGPAGAVWATFDLLDKSTFPKPFEKAKNNGLPTISAVYIVVPDAEGNVIRRATGDFIDLALKNGAKRFVFLSASPIEMGDPWMGAVHALLKERGDGGELEWGVLRPTWFQENISEQSTYRDPIVKENVIYSAAAEGKIPFISADDIAACAKVLLLAPEAPNSDFILVGPEPLTYADVAAILTKVLGRTITHVSVNAAEFARQLQETTRMPAEIAQVLADMDVAIAGGSEERRNDVVFQLTGKRPKTFETFTEENKAVWA